VVSTFGPASNSAGARDPANGRWRILVDAFHMLWKNPPLSAVGFLPQTFDSHSSRQTLRRLRIKFFLPLVFILLTRFLDRPRLSTLSSVLWTRSSSGPGSTLFSVDSTGWEGEIRTSASVTALEETISTAVDVDAIDEEV
ncbi:hypothetical protein RRG08_011474, partial [Elysia crispata]